MYHAFPVSVTMHRLIDRVSTRYSDKNLGWKNFGRNGKFRRKWKIEIENFVENRNCGQNSKRWSKMELFKKSKCWSKITTEIVKICQNRNRKFSQISKCSSKIKHFVKNRNFIAKTNFYLWGHPTGIAIVGWLRFTG